MWMGYRSFTRLITVFLLVLSFNPATSNAETALNIQITKAGDGDSTFFESLTMQLKVSGGMSVKYSTCDAFFNGNPDIGIRLIAENKEGRINPSISNFNAKTLEINSTSLECEFALEPVRYFNFANNMIKLPADLNISIFNASTWFSQKTIRMLDTSSIQPSLSIINPLRGSAVNGDFEVTTSIENNEFWNPDNTFAGAFEGAVSNCGQSTHSEFEISLPGIENQTQALANYSRFSGKKIIVTQQSDNVFRYQFLETGQYTICIWQSFVAVSDSNVKSNNGEMSVASVVVNVNSVISNIAYAYNDPIFKRLDGGSPYNFVFKCPLRISSSSDTYECSLQAKSKLTASDLRVLGITSGTKLQLIGSPLVAVCEFNRDDVWITCESDKGLVPDYYAKVYLLEVGFDTPVKFKVRNYLKKYGYTGVRLSENIEQGDPVGSYSWKMNDYDARKKQAAYAPPSAAYQASLSRAIKSSMNSRCQKLPAGFSKYSFKYSKKIFSNDGIPGYIFIINAKTNIQIFEMGNSWQFAPSASTSDQKTWRDWGCGGAIWVNG